MPQKQIDRRTLLRGALATGSLFGLDALFTTERTEAAAVGPNDAVKVTKVEAFVLKNSWVFVKISTDAGITGWGEMLKDDAKAWADRAVAAGCEVVTPVQTMFWGDTWGQVRDPFGVIRSNWW